MEKKVEKSGGRKKKRKKKKRKAYIIQILALDLTEQFLNSIVIRLDSDRVEHFFDIFSRRRVIPAKNEEEVCC